MIYAVGDIHGEYEQFMDLLKKINFSDEDTLYVLGDVLDRGAHPIKTLQYMMEQPNIIPIVGNHELMALECLKFLMQEITDENEDYIETVEMLKLICPNAVGDYIKMLFLDTICANLDRHTFNFGILRDINSGKILGLAPNFDNNMALISRGYPKNITRKNDLLVKLFDELMEHDSQLKRYIPVLTEDMIVDVIKSVGMRVQTKKLLNLL